MAGLRVAGGSIRTGAAKLWRRAGRLRERLPLTNLGLLVGSVSASAYFWFGVPRADYVVQLASLLGLALLALALLAVGPAAWILKRRLRGLPSGPSLNFEAKRGYATALRLPVMRALPVVEVEWDWEDPLGPKISVTREGSELVEHVESDERMLADEVTRRFTVEDAFGLARISLRHKERRSVLVLPHPGRLGSNPVLRAFTSGDELSHPAGELVGDRYDMRSYVYGDPLRLVLWKVYARTGELVVRTPERAISPSFKVIAYLPAASGDEPAAALARVSIETGALGEGWVLGVDGQEELVSDADRARIAIARSRSFRDDPAGQARGLPRFLATSGPTNRSRLIVFAPCRPGPWVDEVASAIKRWNGPSTVAVVTDGLEPEPERKLIDLAKLPAPSESTNTTTAASLRGITTPLVRSGASVIVVDRPSGRALKSEGQRSVA